MRKIPSLLKRDVRLIEPDREIFNYNTVFGLGFVLLIELLENPLVTDCYAISPSVFGFAKSSSPTIRGGASSSRSPLRKGIFP